MLFAFSFFFSIFFFFKSGNKWALCPEGYFLQGLYRTSEEDWLSNIELGKCCKPDSLPNQYGKCIDKAITTSFDNKGLSSCDDGYYMAGFYKGSCNRLYCIETLKCCKMYKSEFTSYLSGSMGIILFILSKKRCTIITVSQIHCSGTCAISRYLINSGKVKLSDFSNRKSVF